MTSALDVAWFFVLKGNGDPSVTQIKLQKLVYYAQGLHLARYELPLFAETIEAWDYGPVVPELRHIHRHKGAQPIFPTEPAFGQIPAESKIVEFLEEVWSRYGHYSFGELIDMTHAEPPWKMAYNSSCKVIDINSIKEYFSSLILDCTEESEDNLPENYQITTTVFMKGGVAKRINLSEVDDFIAKNQVLIEPRKMPRRGQRRTSMSCA